MQVNPYLFYNGNCEEALKYYQKVLGAQIEATMPYGDGPADMPVPADWKTKIMHSRITIDGEVLMASDATPGDYHQPQGFSVALAIEDPAEAERRFNALAEGGTVRMPFGKTFFSNGFRHVRRQVRHSLDGELPEGRYVSRVTSLVGWAKRSVPTIHEPTIGKMVGTARVRLCPPYEALPAPRIDRRQFAPAQQQQPRGQSAAAGDPVPHRRRIGFLHLARGFRFRIHPAAAVDRARGVKSQHRAAGHADPLFRYRHQQQRAGRQAWPVDHHPLAGLAHPIEQLKKRSDLSAGARKNANLGPRGQDRREQRGGDNDYFDDRHSHARLLRQTNCPCAQLR